MKNRQQITAGFENLEDTAVDIIDQALDGLTVQFYREGVYFKCIASWGKRWDHVSISLEDRCPTWEEMCWFKDLFWNKEEMVIQYHPAEADYVNNHPHCLHLWKPQNQTVPKPPTKFVGLKE